MSDIAPSVSNSETDAYSKAREIYFDLNRPTPDIYDLADEVGVDPERLYKQFLKEGWLTKRRDMQQRGNDLVQATKNSLVEKWQESIGAMVREMVQRNLELLDTRKVAVIEYLDAMLLKGQLEAKDAIAYLKVLVDIEKDLQKLAVDEQHRNEDKQQLIQQFQQQIADKTAMLRRIEQTVKKRSGEEPQPAPDEDKRRRRLREIK